MPIPSNLYAEKVFSEQPIAMWALDEPIDFVSLISKEDKLMTSWSISGATLSEPTGAKKQIESSPIVKLATDNSDLVTCTSNDLFSLDILDVDKNNFNIGLYFYSTTNAIEYVKVGYEYTLGSSTIQDLEFYNVSVANAWVFLSKTNIIPPDVSSPIRLIIEVSTSVPGDYEFYINGLSVAQWSEKFNVVSDGIEMISLPENIPLTGASAYPASSYGFGNDTAYYLGNEYATAAYNDGFPMVYGASGVTRLLPNGSNPSLIVPGKGLLNEDGKYQEFTLEFWAKIFSKATEPRRIVGPISSSDGIYVDGPFLVLRIGSVIGSYFVGEWERPMLVNLRVSPNTASLLVNGEVVVTIDIDLSSRTLPLKTSEGKDQDWIGFYAYSDLPLVEIDCVAIYSYKVPEVVAKRRFVYGQGVDTPSNISRSLPGTTVEMDYRVSEYANNYIYPDMGSWNQGIVENLSIVSGSLSTPTYSLPSVVFDDSSVNYNEWLELCNLSGGSEQFSSIDLSLANDLGATGGYIYFDKFNLLSQDTKALYGIYKITSPERQILFKVENSTNGSYLDVFAENGLVKYSFNYPGQSPINIQSDLAFDLDTIFVAGLDVAKMSKFYGGLVAKFFGASRKLSVYVGGQKNFLNTLQGKVYKFGFSNQRNLAKISNLVGEDGSIIVFTSPTNSFDGGAPGSLFSIETDGGTPLSVLAPSGRDGGRPLQETLAEAVNHIASYTLNPRLYLGSFILDISAESYWQDYVPLSYFSKTLSNFDGDKVQTLDYIQLNLDIPKLDIFDGEFLDTSAMPVKSYVSFQYLASGANRTDRTFSTVEPLPASGVVIPGTSWMSTMYEVSNDTIVYLPNGIGINEVALVVHLAFNAKAIIANPIKIKKLELGSQAISYDQPLKVNTKLGVQISAYEKLGLYPNYKGINPFTVYKGSSPYIYLTKTSGLNLRGDFSNSKFRGAFIPINQQRIGNYDVGAIQMFVNYPREYFPSTPTPIIELKAYDRTSIVYLVADNPSGTRGKIYAIDQKTQLKDQLLNFFLNGRLVTEPYILPNEWNVLSFQFIKGMSFSNFAGHIGFIGPLMFNNVSTYRLSEIQSSITSIFRTWAQVPQMFDKEDNEETYWGDFLSSDPVTTWENILFIPTIKTYLIDPTVIFKSFAGTNKSIVSDNTTLKLKDYQYRMYKNISWRSNIVLPV